MGRVIGMDIHRTFAEVVVWEDGRLRPTGRVDMTRSGLEGFGRTLAKTDEVVVEATGNAMAVVRVLSPYVARVIMANPLQVRAFFEQARAALDDDVELTAHFHNTRGQGLANVLAALEVGIDSFESSFGELGGCPVPAGATGNIATEDLVSMLHEMGVETGVDLEALLAAARAARDVLGRPLGSHTLVAGAVDWREAS